MEFLGPGFEGLNSQSAAGILVERLKNAGDLGDRRDALDALLKLSGNHAADVGEAGMPIFADILQAGIADAAMTQTIMGIMLNLVKKKDGSGVGASVSNFLREVQNVQNLLDLLESRDALTAIASIQVLQALQKSAAEALECRILECPAGLQALVEVLRNPREEVRNEVILLLGQLTSSNLEVKKFVAFQEGFERLFDIMSDEGMLEGGGVIVKDCIDICINLLTGSPLTRALFCQSNCLKRFHELIDVRTAKLGNTSTEGTNPPGEGDEAQDVPPTAQASQAVEERGMSAMQCEIACRALDLLMVLILPCDGDKEGASNETEKEKGSFGKAERQSVVAGTEDGLLAEMLAHVGFSRAEIFSRSPKVCREKAMRATGALVDGHPTNQYNMGELLIQDLGLDSVALATLVMEGALGKDGGDPGLNDTYHWVLGCFFHENELVCTQVVSHVIAPPPPPLELEDLESWVPPTPTGKVLLESMSASAEVLFEDSKSTNHGDEDDSAIMRAGQVMSRGCNILAMLFAHGGGLTKEIALRVPLALSPPNTHSTTLLHALLRWLELATLATHEEVQSRAVADVGISVLQLMCRWVHGCSAAARELLGNPANLFVLNVAGDRRPFVAIEEGGLVGSRAVSVVQRTVLKGLACLLLGILLEYVEGERVPRSGGGGGGSGDELKRDLVMKMIQNRVGMSPFMAAIEATKRAFGDVEVAQRRRNRAAREKKRGGSGLGLDAAAVAVAVAADGGFCYGDGELRIDPNFTPLLPKAAEEVRRRVISIFTHGGGDGSATGNGRKSSLTPVEGEAGAVGVAGGVGLISLVELQEKEITGLRDELSKALKRVPRGGGESALEEALKKQVRDLEAKLSAMSSEMGDVRARLSEAMDEKESEQARARILSSEVQGLSVTVGSLERQLLDREAACDGLRRELAAGGDRSQREKELARQVEEARARSSEAGEALESLQRQAIADAVAVEAASEEAAKEANAEAEARWTNKIAELQAALDEATTGASGSTAAASGAGEAWSHEIASTKMMAMVKAEQAKTAEEVESTQKELVESKAALERLERALAERGEEVEAYKGEAEHSRQAADAAQVSLEAERQRLAAAEARRQNDEKRGAAEAAVLREQLDNAVRSLAEASSGGDQQVLALQKELAAAKLREEREVDEFRRRMDEQSRQAKEEATRSTHLLGQLEKRLNEHWSRQLKDKEAVIFRLKEEGRVSKEAAEAGARSNSVRIGALEKEIAQLREEAEHVEVLTDRCARLEEAALAAGADAERRLHEEMERSRDLARGAQGSVAGIKSRLEERRSELAAKAAEVAELTTRLDEVQMLLAKSEDDREAARERARAAVAEVKDMRKAVAAAEKKVKQVENDLEDRDNVIAAVEDARAAQERETERLRDKLMGLGMLQSAASVVETNGNQGIANGTSKGCSERNGVEGHTDLVDKEGYLELLSEHEDLLQLLAQQEVVRKTLLKALTEIAGKASTRAVMTKAEANVTATYGGYVRYAEDEHYDSDDLGFHDGLDGISRMRSGPEAMGVDLGSTNGRRVVC